MEKILLELDSESRTILDEIPEQHAGDFMLVDSDRFDGMQAMQLLVTLTTFSVPFVTKIVLERIRANRHVEIRKGGFTIKGLTADNAAKIIQELNKK
jgi:hypothetical protein